MFEVICGQQLRFVVIPCVMIDNDRVIGSERLTLQLHADAVDGRQIAKLFANLFRRQVQSSIRPFCCNLDVAKSTYRDHIIVDNNGNFLHLLALGQ